MVWDEAGEQASNQHQEENAAGLHWEMKAQVLQPAGPEQLESLSPAPCLPQKGI